MPTSRAASDPVGARSGPEAAGGARSLPLTGADCFLRAFDAETRRRNGASHASQLVLRLGPGFDLAGFRTVLARVVDANPILRAPIRRRRGIGAPVYQLDAAGRVAPPRVEVHERVGAPTCGPAGARLLPDVFPARLNAVFAGRRGELLRADVVRYDGGAAGTDLALTWLHLLFDGAGSEAFVAFLEAVRVGARAADEVPAADRPGAPPDLALPASARERGAMATAWQQRMRRLGGRRIRSLAGPLRGVRQDLTYAAETYPEEASARIRERASRLAGFLTPMLFYASAAIRAHHAVLRKRAAEPAGYVVPLPVNLRPKAGGGALFRTRVSMIWLAADAAVVDDLDALLRSLKEQRREAIRDRQIECGVAAMDYARFVPARLYARMARRPLGGELCSFFFAYTDEFCPDVPYFFDARVEHGFHAPSVPASPGSGLVFSLRGGRVHQTHVWQRGVLDEGERALFREQLARDLVGAG